MTRVSTEKEVDLLLAHLGVERSGPSLNYLATLQRAWSLGQPFHNLDLLAAFERGAPALDRRGAWLRCVEGLGGPCDVQASSFLALLTACGFDAHFAAAEINHPGDHLVVCVHFDGRNMLCDVGNGHPYLEPFSFEEPTEQSHLGWSVRSRPDGPDLVVEQRTPGSTAWRQVYRAATSAREWGDFEAAIYRHHREVGFGPFLTGLRAVRIAADVAYTLRDDLFTTYGPNSYASETLNREHEEVLQLAMGLGELPVEAAVRTWRRNSGRAA